MQSFSKHSLANDFRIKLENEMRQGIFNPNDIRLSEFLDAWMKSHKKNVTDNTYRSY